MALSDPKKLLAVSKVSQNLVSFRMQFAMTTRKFSLHMQFDIQSCISFLMFSGTHSLNSKTMRLSGPRVDNNLMHSVQSFVTYIQEHFTDDQREVSTDPSRERGERRQLLAPNSLKCGGQENV